MEELLATQLPPSQLGQALIELGALVCTPQSPQCSACPASSWCRVAELPLARLLPIKGGKLTLRDRYFSYIYSTYHQQVLQEKRGRNDIWRGLYQFPLFESDSPQTPEAVAHWVEDELSYSGGGALRLQLSALSTGSSTKYFTLPSTPPNSSPTPWGAPSTNG